MCDNRETLWHNKQNYTFLYDLLVWETNGWKSLAEHYQRAQEVVTLAQQFTMSDGVLYWTSQKQGELPLIVVPPSLKQQIMEEHHAGIIIYVIARHFSGPRLFKTISRKWWWKGMYKDLINYARVVLSVLLLEGQSKRRSHH